MAKEYGLSTAAVTRFLQSKFKNPHKGYRAVCRQEKIGRKLAEWQGEAPGRMADLLPEEYERRETTD